MMSSSRPRRTTTKIIRFEPYVVQNAHEERNRGRTRPARLAKTDEEKANESKENDEYINKLVAEIKESAKKKENSSKRFKKTNLKQKQKTFDETVMDISKSFEKEENEQRMPFEASKSEKDELRGPVRMLKDSRPKQTPRRSIVAIPPPVLQSSSEPFIAQTVEERAKRSKKKDEYVNKLVTEIKESAKKKKENLSKRSRTVVTDLNQKQKTLDETVMNILKNFDEENERRMSLEASKSEKDKPRRPVRKLKGSRPKHTPRRSIVVIPPQPSSEPSDDPSIFIRSIGQPPILYDEIQIRTRSFPRISPTILTDVIPKFEEKEPEKPSENTPEYNQNVYYEQEIHWGQAWDNTQVQPEYHFHPEPSAGNNELTYVFYPTATGGPIEGVHPLLKAFEPREYAEHYEVVNYPEYADHDGLHTRDQYQFWHQDPENQIPRYFL